MKNVNIKKIILFVAIILVVGTLSSCNRGTGCPSNFSITESIIGFIRNFF